MDMTKGKLKVVPLNKVLIHRLARDPFRFSRGLEPQCEVSALRNGSTGTYSPIIPWAVMINGEYHVFSHWHGLLHSSEQNPKIPIISFKDLTDLDIQFQARSFVLQLLSMQFHKATFHAQLFELAKRFPDIKRPPFLQSPFYTPKSFAYRFGQVDKKAIGRQHAQLSRKLNPTGGDSNA